MTDAILTGTVLGVLSGIIPGPYTALVAGKALQRGFGAGARLALVPLFTEIPPMAAATLTLVHTDRNVLRWIGVAGGILFVALGVRLFLRGDEAGAPPSDQGPASRGTRARTFVGVAGAGLLSPAPWLFWFVVGGPLLVRQHRLDGLAAALVMVGCVIGAIMAAAAAIAWGASRGRSLPGHWRRRLVRGAAGFLVVAGGVLVWQAAAGNFQGIIEGQRTVRDLLPGVP